MFYLYFEAHVTLCAGPPENKHGWKPVLAVFDDQDGPRNFLEQLKQRRTASRNVTIFGSNPEDVGSGIVHAEIIDMT